MSVCHLSNWGESVLNIKIETTTTIGMNQEPGDMSPALCQVCSKYTHSLAQRCSTWDDWPPQPWLSHSEHRLHHYDKKEQVGNRTVPTFITECRPDTHWRPSWGNPTTGSRQPTQSKTTSFLLSQQCTPLQVSGPSSSRGRVIQLNTIFISYFVPEGSTMSHPGVISLDYKWIRSGHFLLHSSLLIKANSEAGM